MKKVIMLLVSFFCVTLLHAQQKAVTETGEEVFLYDDGTWKYQDENVLKETEIATNPKKYKKDKKSTFLIKSQSVNVGYWINPKVWSFSKGKENPEAEYEFKLKNGDLYGMIISEQVEIPLATMKGIAFDNAKSIAPDLRIVKEEYRDVNGLKVLHLQMNGTMQGIKFSYFGYYYSNENGTVQFITYTSQNLLQKYKPVSETLLNGLVLLDEVK
ncbi:hypothetical protein [Flammeovirga sp. EKP202]|uniref:hypothetical protein n=1 Tax=Flammeovirga sp. EKP202 TaxID=2770592 RepID=UPI00165FEEB1|nr:hypothetical protein [Flammeovirga sp. EKP202]MBD0401989.1 hypothetical protein [Flammeovirga sp. EKP202]